MISYKVQAPTTELPPQFAGKYGELYRAVHALQPGQWLPVVFDNEADARKVQQAASVSGYHTRNRGTTVYFRTKAKTNGNGQ